jgi:GNAT superfamily N-acetyltransferase
VASVEHHASGLEYLELVTKLLQTARRANPSGGIWEAADLQWWWRRDQHPDPARQTIWLDRGTPRVALIFTDRGGRSGCDLLSARHDPAELVEVVWPRALEQIRARDDESVEMIIRDDDIALIDAVTTAGFEATDEAGVETWMLAADRPVPPPRPDGFELTSYSPARPHHMIGRNGEHVAERLAECSLYRRDLDLMIHAANGEVAAHGLFWVDPVTGVELVEPMRTDDAYQGMGLGRHLLAAGLERLAAHGCSRMKASYIVGNEAARRLYLGAGFRRGSECRTYRRS